MYTDDDTLYGNFGHSSKRRTFRDNRIKSRKKKFQVRFIVLILSLILLSVLVAVFLITSNITNRESEVIEFSITDNTSTSDFGGQVTSEDYQSHIEEQNQVETINQTFVKPEEKIEVGDTGVMGETLTIENIDTDWIIDTSEYGYSTFENKSDIVIPVAVIYARNDGIMYKSDTTAMIGRAVFGPTITSEQLTAQREASNTVAPKIYKASVTEYISADKSGQNMNYIVYAPENADENTPIFVFLHGIGSNGSSYSNFITTYSFLKYLISGSWAPDVIIVSPIQTGGGNWATSAGRIKTIISEVIAAYGGNWDNLYISGFSAGSNGLTPIAKEINFKGAIYIGGYLGGINNTMDVDSFLNLWQGKRVYYYRENLWNGIGYGYESAYVNACLNYASAYNVDFIQVDMNWDHRSGVVDATFLPGKFKDNKNQYCHNGIEALIYH